MLFFSNQGYVLLTVLHREQQNGKQEGFHFDFTGKWSCAAVSAMSPDCWTHISLLEYLTHSRPTSQDFEGKVLISMQCIYCMKSEVNASII